MTLAEIIGLKAIAQYMGAKSPATPLQWLDKYGFPIYRKPAHSRFGWRWCVDTEMVLRWKAGMSQNARQERLRAANARKQAKALHEGRAEAEQTRFDSSPVSHTTTDETEDSQLFRRVTSR